MRGISWRFVVSECLGEEGEKGHVPRLERFELLCEYSDVSKEEEKKTEEGNRVLPMFYLLLLFFLRRCCFSSLSPVEETENE